MQKTQIGFGTAAIGRPQYINVKEKSTSFKGKSDFIQKGIDVLQHAYEKGIRYFDTAPGYGIAEEMLSTWISQKNITDVIVASKWGYDYTANFDPNATIHEVKDLSHKQLEKQWLTTFKLLPNVSVYQIHSATLESGVLDDQKVLEKLRKLKEKYSLKIGLTASGEKQVDVVEKAMNIDDKLFDVFQLTFNILEQSVLKISKQLLSSHKTVVCKESLANGRLIFWNKFKSLDKLGPVIANLSSKYGVGSDAIALAFAVQSLPCQIVLSGAATKQHLDANLQADKLVLTEEEVNMLSSFAQSPEVYWTERKQLKWN